MRLRKQLTILDRGRPVAFAVHSMAALPMESWLMRAAEIMPPGTIEQAASDPVVLAARILERGLIALACTDYEKAAPLLEELLQCCALLDPKTGEETPCDSTMLDNYITDLRTLLALRDAALKTNLAFVLNTERRPLGLPKETAYRRAVMEQTYARTVNIPPVASTLISQGAASLADLQTTYSYMDALDMFEILTVRNYNQWAAYEAEKHKKR